MFVERYNSQDEIPEDSREEYREVTRGDETFFQHKAFAGLVDALENSKSKTSKYKEDFESVNSRLSKFEQEAIDKEEQLKRDALEKGNDREKVYEYDLKKRDEANAALTSQIEEFKAREKNREINLLTSKVAQKVAKKDAIEHLEHILKPRIDYKEDGSVLILDRNGNPTSLDLDGLIADVNEDPYYSIYKEPLKEGLSSNNVRNQSSTGAKPKTLEECKGDRKLEAEFFNEQLMKG